MLFPGVRLFRAPIWYPSGGGGTREEGSLVAESLVALYRVGTHQIWRGKRKARSSKSQGSVETLCARIKGTNREEVFLREKLISGHGLFFPYEVLQGAANWQDSWGFIRDAHGFGWLDAGSRAGFASSGSPRPWTPIFHFSLFLYNV